MRPLFRWLIGVVLSLAACGCGLGHPTRPAEAGPAISIPAHVDVTPNAADLVAVLDKLAELSSVRGRILAACMAQGGFAQPEQAIRLSRATPADLRSTPTTLVMLDLGPTTTAEAVTYGMIGSTIPLSQDRAGYVVSNDPAFDSRAKVCSARIAHALPGLDELQRDGARFEDTVRSAFADRLSAPLTLLFHQRLACVHSSGFPALDPKVSPTQTWEQTLAPVGITQGTWTHPPKAKKPPRGEVATHEPPAPPTYRPTAEEIRFARAYVTCGESEDIAATVNRLSASARASLARTYADNARTYYRRLSGLSAELIKLRRG